MATERDPLERMVDALVALPVCTAIAAARAVPVALHAGARQLARVAAAAAGEPRPAHDVAFEAAARSEAEAPEDSDDAMLPDVEPDAVEPGVGEPNDAALGDADVAVDDLPIDGYDQLAARQIVDRLASLTAAELELVARYEVEHRHRSTVLGKIDQLAAAG